MLSPPPLLPLLPLLLLLLGLVQILPTHGVPHAGTSSGYALRFQGLGELASMASSFKDVPDGAVPNSSDGLTISFWFKLLTPKCTNNRVTLFGDISSFKLVIMFYISKGLNGENVEFSTFLSTKQETADAGHGFEYFEKSWHHIAVTSTNGQNGVATDDKIVTSIYVDGELAQENTDYPNAVGFDEVAGVSVGSYADFGSEFVNLNVADDHYNGYIDELSIYSRALSSAEISAFYASKADTTDLSLVMYYDFEDAYNNDRASNLGSGGAALDLLLGASHQGELHLGPPLGTNDPTVGDEICRAKLEKGAPIVYCEPAMKPQVTNSGAPIAGASGYDVVQSAVIGGPSKEITLPGEDPDDAAATLTFTINMNPTEGTVTLLNNIATYTPPATSLVPSDTFAYTVTAASGTSDLVTVRVIFAVPPVAEKKMFAIVEDRNGTVILNPVDPTGFDTTNTILTLPTGGKLYESDGTDTVLRQITTDLLPFDTPNHRFKFVPFQDVVVTQYLTYTVTNAEDLTSEPGELQIDIYPDDDRPTALAQTEILSDSNGAVAVQVAVFDPDSEFVSVYVDRLPVQGVLLYDEEDKSGLVQLFNPFFVPPPTPQYGAEILETSTFYPNGELNLANPQGWQPEQALGEPEEASQQVFGDSKLALTYYKRTTLTESIDDATCGISTTYGPPDGVNNFDNFDPVLGVFRRGTATDCWNDREALANHGYSQFFTMKFDEKVFIKDIEIGENRGMGSIVSIEAWDYRTSSWMVIWSGEPDVERESFYKETKQYSIFVPYPLCQPTFRTDIIKVKMDTITIDDWNEIDYVKLAGSTIQNPGLLEATSLFYQPPPNLSCIDNFQYKMSDCGGQLSRMGKAQTVKLQPPAGASSTLTDCEPLGETATLNIGLLVPIYAYDKDSNAFTYDAGGHDNLVGAFMAIEEINDKDNGFGKDLLPNTVVKFEFFDSKNDEGYSQNGAVELARNSFDGKGSDVIIGPGGSDGSSDTTVAVQLLLRNFGIPQMSYSAKDPVLSDNGEFPTFFRTTPSDAYQGAAIASFIKQDLTFDKVCVINTDDSFSRQAAAAFLDAAAVAGVDGLQVLKRVEAPAGLGADEAEGALDALTEVNCVVYFLAAQAADAGTVIKSAVARGIMGETRSRVWLFPDSVTDNLELVQEGAGVEDIHAVLKGTLGCRPLRPSGARYDDFSSRYKARTSTSDCTSTLADSAGKLLFSVDHDSNPATPQICKGINFATSDPNDKTYYAYDAVYAFAHAAHAMISGDTPSLAFNGAEMLEQLKVVSFMGVTGQVAFESTGDREEGIGFTFEFHDGEEYKELGDWRASTNLVFKDGMGVESITWAGAGGVKPDDDLVIELLGGSDGIHVSVIIGIVIGFLVLVVVVAAFFKNQIAAKEKEVADLKHDLMMVQQYSDKEQQMIQDMIVTFRNEHHNAMKGKQEDEGNYDKAAADRDLEKLLIKSTEIQCEDVVGKGSFGEVFKAKYRGSTVAVKTMKEVSENSLKRFKAEVLLSGDLNHSNIVAMVGACWERDLMALVMEFCAKGMSSEVLENEGAHFSWDDPLLKWCLDVCKAMKYLHGCQYYDVRSKTQVEGIIHRDLKPDNCLVTDSYSLKVADFGEARANDDQNTMTQVGTPIFISPEVVRGDHYGKKADVFSFAMTALQFALRGRTKITAQLHEWLMDDLGPDVKEKLADLTMSLGRISHNLVSKDWRPVSKVLARGGITAGTSMPDTIAGLITICWHRDPDERPDFDEIIGYLETSAKEGISGMAGTLNMEGKESSDGAGKSGRRTSTSGMLAVKIAASKEVKNEMKGNGATLGLQALMGNNKIGELEETVARLEMEVDRLNAELDRAPNPNPGEAIEEEVVVN